MSFLTDLFQGNFSNLGHDLNPSNIFSDTVKDIGGKNTIPEILGGAALALPFVAPEIIGGLGAADAALTAGDVAGSLSASSLGAADAAALPVSAELTAGTIPASIADEFSTAFPQAIAGADPAASSATTALSSVDPLAAAAPNIASTLGSTATTLGGDVSAAANPSILSQITDTLAPVTNTLKTASPIIGLGGLGYNLYQGQQQKSQLNALNAAESLKAQQAQDIATQARSAATPLLNSGTTLTQYLATGKLPADFEAQVKQTIDAAKASIIQGYASRGQNTNPQQNSALNQELSNVDQQAQTLRANLEQQLATAGNTMVQTANTLLSQGLSATQISAEIPIQISKLNSDLNGQMSSAISNFAAALNGSVPNKNAVTLQLPQNIVSPQGVANA